MKVFVEQPRPGVSLTGYLLDDSEEMPNAKPRPAVLIFPGGGYYACSDREAEPVAMAYLAQGFQAFVLRYTTGQGEVFEAALEDAQAALERLVESASDWSIDVERIAVVGFSAGGHLAASLGTMGRRRPAALILGYPCILASIGEQLGKKIPDLDTLVDQATPRSFIFLTANDGLVPAANGLAWAAALDRAGVPFELHVWPDGAHGLSLAQPVTSAGNAQLVSARVAQWLELSVAFLKEGWGDFPSS
ncbi:MAG: alpha/beta hydrolase [Propionibacteriaceae bacterium]|jgi:acetyl esterase/lipase|nr:alpha/beta hydrolase [Propionibacteriaceae bacterium]